MKLYYNPASSSSRAVLLGAAMLDLHLDTQVVDLMSGEHHEDWYAALNPNRVVPLLDDDGFLLTESAAILKYLAASTPRGTELYPTDPKARARVDERIDWFATTLLREVGYHCIFPQVFDHHRWPDDASNQRTIERGCERGRTVLNLLDTWLLADGPFLCGENLTLADLWGATALSYLDLIGGRLDQYPNVHAWMQRMRDLPHWGPLSEAHNAFAASLSGHPFSTP